MGTKEIDLSLLKKEIPCKWKVQGFTGQKDKAMCVAYIDSRQVQDILDEIVGTENWQCEFYEVKGVTYCKIGIFINSQWIYKSDAGSFSSSIESTEEKGEASDAFKRAGVMWGIGRFLYDYEIAYIGANPNGNKPYAIDENGKRLYDITKYLSEKGLIKKKYKPTSKDNQNNYQTKPQQLEKNKPIITLESAKAELKKCISVEELNKKYSIVYKSVPKESQNEIQKLAGELKQKLLFTIET